MDAPAESTASSKGKRNAYSHHPTRRAVAAPCPTHVLKALFLGVGRNHIFPVFGQIVGESLQHLGRRRQRRFMVPWERKENFRENSVLGVAALGAQLRQQSLSTERPACKHSHL